MQRVVAAILLAGTISNPQPVVKNAIQSILAPICVTPALIPSHFTSKSYVSDNAAVILEFHEQENAGLSCPYIVADVYVPDVHAIRSWYLGDTEASLQVLSDISDVCETVNAAFAVNGDFYTLQGVSSVKNGTVINSCVSWYDLCVLLEDGTMKTYFAEELQSQKCVEEALCGAWQAWSFGPTLLDHDGRAIPDFSSRATEYLTRKHYRTAIGYYQPGHYCFVNVFGTEDIPGVTLEELSLLFERIGCSAAYNLDGGNSAHMWFDNSEQGTPRKECKLADIIYIEKH